MPRESSISDETRALVVRLYREGKKGKDISVETGVSQPMIYSILAEVGERPNRQRQQLQEITAAEVLEQLRIAEHESARWKTLYEREREVNERLMEELRENLAQKRTPAAKIPSRRSRAS